MDQSAINCLELKSVYKSFPNEHSKNAVHALVDINLQFTNGIYGITGKNGAGKSTLMQIITGYAKADRGSILWNGTEMNPRSKQYKSLLGYMPQQQAVYETMNCQQFMNYFASLKGINGKTRQEQVEKLLERVHLAEKRYAKIETLSGGMKQRLLFAQACLGNPAILLLDEPTAGVDPEERKNLQQMVSEASDGKIVIMSTHIMSDIEEIAKQEIRLEKGRVGSNVIIEK